MNVNFLFTSIVVWSIGCTNVAFAVSRVQDPNRDLMGEPSCEQLKAMWRYSKRQSKTAEITNELPSYIDPFAYNIWNPIYTARSRSIGGFPVANKYRSRPIYGRIVQRPTLFRVQDAGERNKGFEEVARMYGQPRLGAPENRKQLTTYRVAGGHPLAMPRRGSFQHLKNIVQLERARDLLNQHIAEEADSRSAALNREPVKNNQPEPTVVDANDNYDVEDHDEQPEGGKGIMVFPDILAPASNTYQDDIDTYYRENPYQSPHGSAFLDRSHFNSDLDSMML